jgi:hypothetical protein
VEHDGSPGRPRRAINRIPTSALHKNLRGLLNEGELSVGASSFEGDTNFRSSIVDIFMYDI